jgi:hypothetical protein
MYFMKKVKVGIPFLFSLRLAPGQVYPLPLELALDSVTESTQSVTLELDLIHLDTLEPFSLSLGRYDFTRRTWGETYKMTFLDYDSVVHYGRVEFLFFQFFWVAFKLMVA